MAFPRLNNISFWLLLPLCRFYAFIFLWKEAGTGWTYIRFILDRAHSGPSVDLQYLACT